MERQQSSSEQPTTSLVALNSEYQSIAKEMIALGGELTPESEARLDASIKALCEKADAYGVVQDNLTNQAAFWKFQKDRCAQAEKACTNAVEQLRSRMKFVLSQVTGESLQGDLYRFFLAKSADTLDIKIDELPKNFLTTEIKVVADREKIEAALSRGEDVPGVTKTTGNKSLRVGRPK